ncbi:MAG TPA: sensor domain-containing protein [Luteimonas sp.]|nr:sensor domain-containing protein [Luteimonas sp.]
MNTMHDRPLPTTIPEYLAQLRAALAGADPALVQDALYDAEEYLRSELAENPDRSEAEVIASVAGSYGAPEEVADIYRDTEAKVQTALRPPAPPPRSSLLGRFFGVAADSRTYGAMFYAVLALATGIFYFTWVVTGVSLSLGLSVIIIGIPFVILFLGSVRLLSLVEGRIVETMLGERMPRRPLYADRDIPLLTRIGRMFTDPRTWSTLVYMLLMLPLGILYFSIAVTLLATSLGLVVAPLLAGFGAFDGWSLSGPMFGYWEPATALGFWELPLAFLCGVVLLFATLHLLRGIGRVHGAVAKHLLVKV